MSEVPRPVSLPITLCTYVVEGPVDDVRMTRRSRPSLRRVLVSGVHRSRLVTHGQTHPSRSESGNVSFRINENELCDDGSQNH